MSKPHKKWEKQQEGVEMKKFIRCAKCDCEVETREFCACGNKIADFCKEHKVLYELNILPSCPVCLITELTADSAKKLKEMLKERKSGKTIIITLADGIRFKKKPEERVSSYPSYIPAPLESHHPKPPRSIPAKVATRMVASSGIW